MQFGWSEDELQNEASAPSVVKRFEIVGLHGYRNVGLHSPSAATVVIAQNGSGKTTLLAALHAFLKGHFFRFRDIKFDFMRCELDGVEGELRLNWNDLREYLTQGFSDVANFALEVSMEVEDLLEFIEGEYHNNYFSSTPRDPEELSYEVYRRCGYSLKNAEKFCQKVKTEISLRHPVVGALKQVIQDRLSEYEIVYLPTFRRIELPIEEEPSNRWKKSTSMKLAKGSFFSAEMNFGLRDVSHRLQEISRKIYVESSLSYREVSADIINDLVSDPNLVNELSGEVPDKDELKLFFDRLGDRKNSRALGVPVKLPDLELMYEKLQFSEENAFLFYFLVKLNGAIRATKLSEERVVGFVDACNKYLGGEDYWKFEDNPQL